MGVLTNWNDVVATEEFQEDLALLTNAVVRSIGNESIIDQTSPYVWAVAYLAASVRYYVRHLTDMKDIDQTPFLQEIAAEVGLNMPLSAAFPLVQLLRENKRFFGAKGTETIYHFIGSLFTTRVALFYPYELIFTLDDDRCCLDGAATESNSILPFAQSNLAYIRDGIYWSMYVFVLQILDAQNITEFGDFISLLQSVHPAGTKEFRTWVFNWISETTQNPQTFLTAGMLTEWGFMNEFSYPVLDDGFLLDSDGSSGNNPGSFLDNLTGSPAWLQATLDEWTDYQHDDIYNRMWSDQTDEAGTGNGLLHTFIPGKPWASFSRFSANPDGTYTKLYADTDAAVMENVTTNVGLLGYTISELANFSIRELTYAALDKDQQNMRGMWTPEMLYCSFEQTS